MSSTQVNTAPEWMTDKQADAHTKGVRDAIEAANTTAANVDHRIRLDDVVSYRVPAFLTNDYDPTYRPAVRR